MQKEKQLSGLFIYRDNKDRTIFHHPFNKKGYLISSDKEKNFKVLSNGYIYGIVAGIFAKELFKWNIIIALIIGIVVTGVIYYRFNQMLNNCVQYPNFKPQKQNYSEGQLKSILVKTILYFIISFVLLLSTFFNVSKDDSSLIVISYTIIIICISLALKNLFTYTQIRRLK